MRSFFFRTRLWLDDKVCRQMWPLPAALFHDLQSSVWRLRSLIRYKFTIWRRRIQVRTVPVEKILFSTLALLDLPITGPGQLGARPYCGDYDDSTFYQWLRSEAFKTVKDGYRISAGLSMRKYYGIDKDLTSGQFHHLCDVTGAIFKRANPQSVTAQEDVANLVTAYVASASDSFLGFLIGSTSGTLREGLQELQLMLECAIKNVEIELPRREYIRREDFRKNFASRPAGNFYLHRSDNSYVEGELVFGFDSNKNPIITLSDECKEELRTGELAPKKIHSIH